MKYMGSKQALLRSGLGALIEARAEAAERIVDLFSGTAAVSWFAAKRLSHPVLAVDLQEYSRVLANAVLLRTKPIQSEILEERWISPSIERLTQLEEWREAQRISRLNLNRRGVETARKVCASPCNVGSVWNSYGGYYFSPAQAITLDLLRSTAPAREPERSVCLAALVIAASRCAAAPGHTAQPFRPTPTALPFIVAAWRRDIVQVVRDSLAKVAREHARVKGRAVVGDASSVAETLGRGDLVIVDPPYSSAQYSRFYHVLETIVRGHCGPVEGAGRYPPIAERPQSEFSRRTTVRAALSHLLGTLARRNARVIVTFPHQGASTGVEGEELVTIAGSWFYVDVITTSTSFSTMGGNGAKRAPRRKGVELIVSLEPRR